MELLSLTLAVHRRGSTDEMTYPWRSRTRTTAASTNFRAIRAPSAPPPAEEQPAAAPDGDTSPAPRVRSPSGWRVRDCSASIRSPARVAEAEGGADSPGRPLTAEAMGLSAGGPREPSAPATPSARGSKYSSSVAPPVLRRIRRPLEAVWRVQTASMNPATADESAEGGEEGRKRGPMGSGGGFRCDCDTHDTDGRDRRAKPQRAAA